MGRRLLWVAVLAAAACEFGVSKDERPRGPPVMLSFEVVDQTGAPVATMGAQPGVHTPVSPRVSLVARFDRLLDGAAIEDTSGMTPVGRDVATVTWTGGRPPAGSIATQVTYVPNGDAKFHLIYPPGPQLLISAAPTLPSGAQIDVILDRARLRSKDGEGPLRSAEGVADHLTFLTLPFSASVTPAPGEMAGMPAPSAMLGATEPITVRFSNLPAAEAPRWFTVTLTDPGGGPTPAALAVTPDPADPMTFALSSPAGAWPAGATVELSIDPTTSDLFGAPITGATTARFVVAP